MTLDQLIYFRKLAELQNFSKSAIELYISQPSLSYSIKNLEKELGVSLFQKKGRNVVLTNNGKEFYKYVVEVLDKLNDGVAMLKQKVESASNKIRIGTLPLLPCDFISKNFRSYMKSSPNTKFDIFTCKNYKEVIDGIYDGNYDIGVCFKEVIEKDLVYVPLLKQELVVMTKFEHPLSKKERILITDLQDYPLITYRDNNPLGIYIRDLFVEHQITPNIVFSFDDEITISKMVDEDFGIAVLANLHGLQNFLSIIPLNLKSDSPIIYLVYHRNTNHSKEIKNFINHLKTSTKL